MVIAKTATKIIDNVTVALSASADSSGVDLSSAIKFGVGFSLTFNAAATAGARVELYADPAGAASTFTIGANDDPCDFADIELDAGNTVSGFIPLLDTPKYVKARIVNEDDTYSITALSVWSQVQTA